MVHVKRFTSPTQSFGAKGEQLATDFLITEGFRIVARNVSGSYGEIDIIARKGSLYYFFEVKAGKVGGIIHPAENLTRTKLNKLFKTVEYYCCIHRIREYCIKGVIVLIGNEVTVEIVDL